MLLSTNDFPFLNENFPPGRRNWKIFPVLFWFGVSTRPEAEERDDGDDGLPRVQPPATDSRRYSLRSTRPPSPGQRFRFYYQPRVAAIFILLGAFTYHFYYDFGAFVERSAVCSREEYSSALARYSAGGVVTVDKLRQRPSLPSFLLRLCLRRRCARDHPLRRGPFPRLPRNQFRLDRTCTVTESLTS